MRKVSIEMESLTPYSSSLYFEPAPEKGETLEAHEQRRWREKLHTDDDGLVFIPGVAFKLALDFAVRTLKEKIKGKGNQTYNSIFASGVSAISDVPLGIKAEKVKPISIFSHSGGKRTDGTRVIRWFPIIPNWRGTLEMCVFNDALPEEVFERYFVQAGLIAGVGRGRPEKGCPAGNGRFKPLLFTWS